MTRATASSGAGSHPQSRRISSIKASTPSGKLKLKLDERSTSREFPALNYLIPSVLSDVLHAFAEMIWKTPSRGVSARRVLSIRHRNRTHVLTTHHGITGHNCGVLAVTPRV